MRKRLGTGRTPNTKPVVLTEAIGTRVHIGAIQVQAVATEAIVRSRRPIVAVGPSNTRRRAIEAAGVEEVVWVFTQSFSGSIAISICF